MCVCVHVRITYNRRSIHLSIRLSIHLSNSLSLSLSLCILFVQYFARPRSRIPSRPSPVVKFQAGCRESLVPPTPSPVGVAGLRLASGSVITISKCESVRVGSSLVQCGILPGNIKINEDRPIPQSL